MRRFLVLLCSVVLLSTPARACLTVSLSQTLFAKALPQPPLEADVIVRVDLLEVQEGTATAKVLEVLKAPGAQIREGNTVTLKYDYSSCGPDHRAHEQGLVIAQAAKDPAGRDVLLAYTYQRDSGRVYSPPKRTGRQ